MKNLKLSRSIAAALGFAALVFLTGGGRPAYNPYCGQFTDVSSTNMFCPGITEAYNLGVMNGSSPTTFGPSGVMTRDQLAATVSRSYDTTTRRVSRRGALNQWWTNTGAGSLLFGVVAGVPTSANTIRSDGTDIWVSASDKVFRVRGSDASLLDTWTVPGAGDILVAMGRIFVSGTGGLYAIDPSLAPSPLTAISGSSSGDLAYDGKRIWTVQDGTASILTPKAGPAFDAVTVTGFDRLVSVLFDGANIWVVDNHGGLGRSSLLKLDSSGNVLTTVLVGSGAVRAVFDGTNIWVPAVIDSLWPTVTVVRAVGINSGTVLPLSDYNGLQAPIAGAFDGERIAFIDVTSYTIAYYRASDLKPLGFASLGSLQPRAIGSDGMNFWVATTGGLIRF